MNIRWLSILLFTCISSLPALAQVGSVTESSSLNNELFDAVSNGYYTEVENLLNKKANVNTYSEAGITPLLYAVDRNDYRIVQLLLDHKADPNARAKTSKEEFPLLIASERGFGRIVDILFNYGANANLTNYYGITPLHYASFYNDTAILQKLLDRKANVNAVSAAGETPLLYAAFNGSLFATVRLLEYGANPDLADNEGYSPLMVASQNGHSNVVYELLRGGANVNMPNKKGFSGLSYAIINNRNEIADLLLLNGANINEQNTISLNPLALAKIAHNKPVQDSLRKAGAKRNFLPAFKYAGSIGLDFRFNNKDLLTGLVFSKIDVKYGLELSVFYFLRPFAVPVLQGGFNNTFYQYWERRHIIGISLGKRFKVFESSKSSFLLSGEGLYEYHFGRYRGTTINNKGGLYLSPRVGLIYVNKNFDFRLSWQYTNYSITGLRNWYAGCGVRWDFKRKFHEGKDIYLIDYK